MDIGKQRIDVAKSTEGVWFDIDGETSLLIARIASPHYREVLRKHTLPFREAIRNGTYGQKEQDSVTVKTLAEAALLGWKGLKENGKDVPYSVEQAEKYLADPALEWFRETVEECGTRLEQYYEQAEETLKK